MNKIYISFIILLSLVAITFAADVNKQQTYFKIDKPLKFSKMYPEKEFRRYLNKPFNNVLKMIGIVQKKSRAPIEIFTSYGQLIVHADGSWELKAPPQIYYLYLGSDVGQNWPEAYKINPSALNADYGVDEKGIIDYLHYGYNILEFNAKLYLGDKDLGSTHSFNRPIYRSVDVFDLANYKTLPTDAGMQICSHDDDNYLWFLVMRIDQKAFPSELKEEIKLLGDSWFITDLFAVKKSSIEKYEKELSEYLVYDYDYCMARLEELYNKGELTDAEYQKIKSFFGDKLYINIADKKGTIIVSLPKIVLQLQEISKFPSSQKSEYELYKGNILRDVQ